MAAEAVDPKYNGEGKSGTEFEKITFPAVQTDLC